MRKTLLIFILLCSKLSFGQLFDNFSDGSFTNNPTWTGSSTYFQVIDGVLNSNGPQMASTVYLSTTNTLATNVAWEFYLNLGFDPSTTNFPRIYLISNLQDLTTTTGLQAYYLQLGSSSSAENFSLIKQNGNISTSILALPDKIRPNASTVNVRVRVERTASGRWDIYTDFTGGTNWTHDGFVVDNTYTLSSYFGVLCKYSTASRYNLFKFDDFKIESYVDNSSPQIKSINSLNDNAIQVVFDEPIEVVSATNIANYNLMGIGNPSNVEVINTSTVKLNYNSPISTGNYTLSINNIADIKGNSISTVQNANFFHIKSYLAKKGDVLINEIMAAPVANSVLNKEYIELFNTTDNYIIITGWKYKDASNTTATFAADTLSPKSYRIVCAAADVSLFKTYGKTLGITPWPTLNNDKDDLNLSLSDGTLIDAVSYNDTWYGDNSKKTGYTLELINPNSPCAGAFNWTASNATDNGTPGQQNSTYNPSHLDLIAPKLVGIEINTPTEIQVIFDKAIPISILTDVNNYAINNGIGKPINVTIANAENKIAVLTLANPILVNTENTLTVNNIANCAGVPLNSNENTALVIITEPIKPNEILISEILFNPRTNSFDFVEIYNNSDKILDLKELKISNPSLSGSSNSLRFISNTSVFIRPKTYWVITANKNDIITQYQVKFPNQVVAMSTIPTFNVSSGSVKIWKDTEGIDSLNYTDKMHHPLLKDVKGVSLERLSFAKPANASGNMASAAASSGFATPTYQNSQSEEFGLKNNIHLVNKTFSPDNDGFEDELTIKYQLKTSGYLATINIYNDKGFLVRKLLKNSSIATTGNITWDGKNDLGQLCKIGIYTIKMNIFNINGENESFTKNAVLAAKLN